MLRVIDLEVVQLADVQANTLVDRYGFFVQMLLVDFRKMVVEGDNVRDPYVIACVIVSQLHVLQRFLEIVLMVIIVWAMHFDCLG